MRHDSVTFVVSERVPLNSIPTLHYSNRSEVELVKRTGIVALVLRFHPEHL